MLTVLVSNRAPISWCAMARWSLARRSRRRRLKSIPGSRAVPLGPRTLLSLRVMPSSLSEQPDDRLARIVQRQLPSERVGDGLRLRVDAQRVVDRGVDVAVRERIILGKGRDPVRRPVDLPTPDPAAGQ